MVACFSALFPASSDGQTADKSYHFRLWLSLPCRNARQFIEMNRYMLNCSAYLSYIVYESLCTHTHSPIHTHERWQLRSSAVQHSALNNLYVTEIWAICARHMNEYDDCVVYFIGSLSVFFLKWICITFEAASMRCGQRCERPIICQFMANLNG